MTPTPWPCVTPTHSPASGHSVGQIPHQTLLKSILATQPAKHNSKPCLNNHIRHRDLWLFPSFARPLKRSCFSSDCTGHLKCFEAQASPLSGRQLYAQPPSWLPGLVLKLFRPSSTILRNARTLQGASPEQNRPTWLTSTDSSVYILPATIHKAIYATFPARFLSLRGTCRGSLALQSWMVNEDCSLVADTRADADAVFRYEFYKVVDENDEEKNKHLVMWEYRLGLVRITPMFKALDLGKVRLQQLARP